MTIELKGKIILESANCQHCNNRVFGFNVNTTEICRACGAKYELVKLSTNNNIPSAEFKFTGFNCMELSYIDSCSNTCPTSNMYCEEHSNDSSIEKVRREISAFEDKIKTARDKLRTINASRKTWAISKLSGMSK